MTYGFADILNDGRAVVGRIGAPVVDFGARAVDVSTPLGFTRATMWPALGKAFALGQGNGDGRAWLVCEDGRTLNLGPTYGVNCVALVANGSHLYATVQVAVDQAVVFEIGAAETLAVIGSRSVPIPATSQGFSGATSDGTPILMDPIFRTIAGKLVGYVCQVNDLTLAQDNDTGNPVIARHGEIGTLAQGACFEPHLSPNGEHWICRSDSPQMLSGAVPAVMPPYIGPAPSPSPPPIPVPAPQPTPPPSPSPIDQGSTRMQAQVLKASDVQFVAVPSDFLRWKETIRLTRVAFTPKGIAVQTEPSLDRWPNFRPPGWDGDLQLSLGLVIRKGGTWYGAPILQCWRGLVTDGVGDNVNNENRRQVAKNWLYMSNVGDMQGYQPSEGEPVGIFLSSGDCISHGGTDFTVRERSNIVVVPFTFNFVAYDLEYGTPAPVPTPTPQPTPTPVPTPTPTPVPSPAPIDLTLIAGLLKAMQTDLLEQLEKRIDKLEQGQRTQTDALKKELKALAFEGTVRVPVLGSGTITLKAKA